MAYSVVADIQSEFKSLDINSTSAISSTEVTEFIAQADAEINGRIGLKYTVPVTASAALSILKTISIGIVSQRIKNILRFRAGASEEEGDSFDSAKLARKQLDLIVEGKLILTGATLVSSGDGVKSYAVDEELEHTFEKSVDQW